MPENARKKFEDVINRAEQLSDAWRTSASKDADDLARFAMVLSVAAMDDFFKNAYFEIWVPYVKRHGFTNKMINVLESQHLSTKAALRLLHKAKPYAVLKNRVKRRYETASFQKRTAINDLFSTLGIEEFCEKAQQCTHRKTLLNSVRLLAKRRHEIVHKGDLTATGILKKVEERDVKRIKDVHLFVSTANQVLDTALKNPN